jgi:hypothetical protein
MQSRVVRVPFITIVWTFIVAWTIPAFAEQTNLPSIGVRSGFSIGHNDHSFYQTELFSGWSPTIWHLGSNWNLRPRIELTAGYLLNHRLSGFVGTCGPELSLQYKDFPVRFDVGVRPTILTRDRFESRSFGVQFQITSHAGLEWEFIPRWTLGYRFQHMSNSGLSARNPGLNTQLFGLGYQF